MRVDAKGRVTIPQPLRAALGLGAGTNLQVERRGDTVVLKRVDGGDELVRRMRGRGDVHLSTAEIMALTRPG